MTELLQRVIGQIEKLPADQQDAIAGQLLAELEDQRAWAERFSATSEEQWARLVEAAKRDIASGDTVSLDDVFPSPASKP
jgi:hypothetical protein